MIWHVRRTSRCTARSETPKTVVTVAVVPVAVAPVLDDSVPLVPEWCVQRRVVVVPPGREGMA